MDFRFGPALALGALVALVPACSALIAPDPARLGGHDGGAVDGSSGMIDAARPDGSVVPDGSISPDGGPVCPASCDDGVACTNDACDTASGSCTHAPNDAACGDGMRCAGPAGCVPILCTTDAECDDGNACNGDEVCNPRSPAASPTTGCVAGGPIDCDDGVDCTEDHCDSSSGCVHLGNDGACDDGADCTSDACSPTGCVYERDDSMCNGGCRTGAVCVPTTGCTGGTVMTCGADGNPCTTDPTMCDAASGMCLHPVRDDDGDGHLIARATGTGGTMVCGGDDCNDANGAVHPGATEVCNGIDDNCEGGIDEGCTTTGPDTCATEQRITLTGGAGTASGANRTLADNYRSMCGGTGGRDAVYLVELGPTVGAVDVTVSTDHAGTSFDTVLAAQVGACGTFSRPCQDDISGMNTHSTITFCVTQSPVSTTQIHILVDGYDGSAGSTGDYTVSVNVAPHPGGLCP